MARTIEHAGETWVSVEDLRLALADDQAILHAAAMLQVAKVRHHDDAIESLRKCIGYWVANAAGVDLSTNPESHHEPDDPDRPG